MATTGRPSSASSAGTSPAVIPRRRQQRERDLLWGGGHGVGDARDQAGSAPAANMLRAKARVVAAKSARKGATSASTSAADAKRSRRRYWSTQIRPRTRPRSARAASRATVAPIEWPTRMTSGASAASTTAATSEPSAAMVQSVRVRSDSPWPARSRAMTRQRRDSAATCAAQWLRSHDQPWIRTSAGAPAPHASKAMRAPSGESAKRLTATGR